MPYLSVCLVLHLVKDAHVHVYSSLKLGIKKLWLVSLIVSFAVHSVICLGRDAFSVLTKELYNK